MTRGPSGECGDRQSTIDDSTRRMIHAWMHRKNMAAFYDYDCLGRLDYGTFAHSSLYCCTALRPHGLAITVSLTLAIYGQLSIDIFTSLLSYQILPCDLCASDFAYDRDACDDSESELFPSRYRSPALSKPVYRSTRPGAAYSKVGRSEVQTFKNLN